MIPRGFNFSQSSLTAYEQCRRRFLLRYLRRMEWPAPLTDRLSEWEEAIRRGLAFHQFVLQQSLGMDVETVVQKSDDPLLVTWWQNWCQRLPEAPEGELLSETMLSVPLAGHRLVAKFDRVLIAADGKVWIFDWKTGRRKPEQAVFAASWQTLVYRFVLAEAGMVLNGGNSIDPADIRLVYWHAQYPEVLRPIGYSAAEHEEARERIAQMIAAISALPDEAAYPKTADLGECRRCEFYTYCDRLTDRGEDWDIDEDELDWELIPEAEL